MSIISSKNVRTRILHCCWGCTKDIPAGSVVMRTTSANNGKAYSVYWCAECQAKMDEMHPDDRSEGFMFGELA